MYLPNPLTTYLTIKTTSLNKRRQHNAVNAFSASANKINKGNSLYQIRVLAAKEKAGVPALVVDKRKLVMGFHCANLNLQLGKRIHDFYSADISVDEITGGKVKYRDLIKCPELRDTWHKSLAKKGLLDPRDTQCQMN